jgi:hypothetical protein
VNETTLNFINLYFPLGGWIGLDLRFFRLEVWDLRQRINGILLENKAWCLCNRHSSVMAIKLIYRIILIKFYSSLNSSLQCGFSTRKKQTNPRIQNAIGTTKPNTNTRLTIPVKNQGRNFSKPEELFEI